MPQRQPPVPEATRFESADEIRQAILARQAQLKGKAPPAAPGQPAAAIPMVEPETATEKPQLRPPMALLCILDDGKLEGELVRLRGDRCLIGRVDGDVRIPHDGMMSGRHAEVVRQRTGQGYRWVLSDLQSTNGTWVRVGRTVFQDGSEVLVGRGHYRFEAAAVSPAAVDPQAATTTDVTRPWTTGPITALVPSLVEVTPGGPGQRIPLTLGEYWIGRDRGCGIPRPDDPVANPRHARLHRDARGQWHIENNKSVNGLWLRVEEVPLGATCQFRLGEQRFLFRVP
jgi:pSer/pThr/pTyr-binding forkhead associated (FHA) protein